jgi:hypothetical protein
MAAIQSLSMRSSRLAMALICTSIIGQALVETVQKR